MCICPKRSLLKTVIPWWLWRGMTPLAGRKKRQSWIAIEKQTPKVSISVFSKCNNFIGKQKQVINKNYRETEKSLKNQYTSEEKSHLKLILVSLKKPTQIAFRLHNPAKTFSKHFKLLKSTQIIVNHKLPKTKLIVSM